MTNVNFETTNGDMTKVIDTAIEKAINAPFLSYVNNVSDTEPKPLYIEVLNRILDAKATRMLVDNYRASGDENSKKALSAVIFNGLYSPELAKAYMNEVPKQGENRHTCRDAECFTPSNLIGLDIDPCEGCNMTAREQYFITCERIKSAFGIMPDQIIAMAYATPTAPGWRLVVRRTAGFTIEQEQERWNTILPFPCDSKCKNLNRLYFMTSREDLFCLNTDLLFPQEISQESKDDASEQAPIGLPSEALSMKQDAEPVPQAITDDYKVPESYQNAYGIITDEALLEDIVNEIEHCIGGGAAKSGNRNEQVFRMAILMRYLVGPNVAMLQRLLPTYGLSQTEHLRTINNALKAKMLPYIPEDLQRAIERATNKANHTSGIAQSNDTLPPSMPKVLPPAIAHLLSAIPEKGRPAAAISSFAAWRIHLHEVSFHYIDNQCQEPCFFNITNATQSEGKTATRMPCECILESISIEDDKNREAEGQWREECSCRGASKDKPKAPSLPIRIVEANMTDPAFVKRAMDAQGYSLYTYAEELEKLQRLNGLSEIMRSAYDGARYGQERVSATAVSLVVPKLRWSFNVSTTPATARRVFKNEFHNGTITRVTIATLMVDENDFGDEMPVYGNFDDEYKKGLAPYIENLRSATGTIYCTEAEEWAERERLRQIDTLRKKDMKYMVPFMRRSLQIGFWRAVMLYIMNGNQWSKEIEDFATWSIDYDLWCKLYYFGDLIESSVGATPDNTRYNTFLLPLLPMEFSREQARNMRRDAGRSTSSKDVRNMLSQWMYRGFIRFDKERNMYVKTSTEKNASQL